MSRSGGKHSNRCFISKGCKCLGVTGSQQYQALKLYSQLFDINPTLPFHNRVLHKIWRQLTSKWWRKYLEGLETFSKWSIPTQKCIVIIGHIHVDFSSSTSSTCHDLSALHHLRNPSGWNEAWYLLQVREVITKQSNDYGVLLVIKQL